MALRYVGLQIAQAREDTGETDYGVDNGIPQNIAVQVIREAVIHCQNSLYLAAPQIFDILTYLDVVQNQVEYDLPDNSYIGSSIASAEYSASGEPNDYFRLSLVDYAYRTGGTGLPCRFVSYGDGKLLLDPPASSAGGQLRIVHGAHLDEPDIRRGKIASATKDGPLTNYTTVVLVDDDDLDESAIEQNEYVCVNDKDGVVKYYNVNYSAYDSTSKTITLNPLTAVGDGTITVGDYITVGRYSTTHIKLDRVADPVILSFLRRRFYLAKSSSDVTNEEDNIAAFTKEMVAVYKRRVRTQKKIPFTGRFENIGRSGGRTL